MAELAGGAPARPVSSGGRDAPPWPPPSLAAGWRSPSPPERNRWGSCAAGAQGEVVRKAAGGGGSGQGGSVDGLWAQSEMYLRGLSPAPEVFSTARGTDVRGW